MPKVEWVTVKGRFETVMKPYFNIDRNVGKGGANLKHDVMLVQALLTIPDWVTHRPQVSGSMDTTTERAIVDFVDNNPYSEMKISDPSGLVRPGFAGGRIEKFVHPKRMIEELNFLVELRAKNVDPGMPKDGPIRFILYAYPSLQGVLRGISIDKFGKVSMKYPAGGIIDVKHRG